MTQHRATGEFCSESGVFENLVLGFGSSHNGVRVKRRLTVPVFVFPVVNCENYVIIPSFSFVFPIYF